jgi:hypothetical protein
VSSVSSVANFLLLLTQPPFLETRLDTTDFRPRLPTGRLLLACAAFGTLGFLFALETRNAFTFGRPITNGFVVERVGIASFMLLVFSSLVLHLLLPLRLRFTEAGIARRTLLRPRFVPWQSVAGARLTSFKGNVWLELKVAGRRTWIVVPVGEYRRAASLLAALRRRLPVAVQHADGPLAAQLQDI